MNKIKEKEWSIALITDLDDIAYLINCRGNDIPYNPVFIAYWICYKQEDTNKITLYLNHSLSKEKMKELELDHDFISIKPYSQFLDDLRDLKSLTGQE